MQSPPKGSSGLVLFLFFLNWNRASVDVSKSLVKIVTDPLGPSGNPRLTNRRILWTKPSFLCTSTSHCVRFGLGHDDSLLAPRELLEGENPQQLVALTMRPLTYLC